MHPLNEFKRRMAMIQPDEILLTGAKPWPGSWQTDHWQHVPSARWVGTDIEPGEGVEIVGGSVEAGRKLLDRWLG